MSSNQSLARRTALGLLIAMLVVADMEWGRATYPGSGAFFLVGGLGLWLMAAAFMLLLTPAQSWPYLGVVSGVAIGWPLAFEFAAAGITCDPAIGFMGGFVELMLAPAVVLYNPRILFAIFAGLAIVAGLSFALYKLNLRPIPRWMMWATAASFPVVVVVAAAWLWAAGARPQHMACVF
jgi:hypothetical protein